MNADIASAKLKLLDVVILQSIVEIELCRAYLEFPLLAPSGVEVYALSTLGLSQGTA